MNRFTTSAISFALVSLSFGAIVWLAWNSVSIPLPH